MQGRSIGVDGYRRETEIETATYVALGAPWRLRRRPRRRSRSRWLCRSRCPCGRWSTSRKRIATWRMARRCKAGGKRIRRAGQASRVCLRSAGPVIFAESPETEGVEADVTVPVANQPDGVEPAHVSNPPFWRNAAALADWGSEREIAMLAASSAIAAATASGAPEPPVHVRPSGR